MHRLVLKLIMSTIFTFFGCFMIGYSTSWHVGVGLFFVIWGFIGLIEIVVED